MSPPTPLSAAHAPASPDRAEHPLVLFDGVCALCASSVQWILLRDTSGVFRFAPLQSTVGEEALQRAGLPADYKDSVVLVEGEGVFTKTDAAWRIVRRLPLPWSLMAIMRWVPSGVRDGVYAIVARNRYRWFGKNDTCWMPRPEWQGRFIAD